MSAASAPSSGSSPLIVAHDIRVSRMTAAGAVHILRGISLAIEAGARVGLVGPSGSGKTTLMMAMAGLEPVTSGTIEIAGQDITDLSENALADFRRDHLGIVFQSFHLMPSMTAFENIALPLELAGRQVAVDEVEEMLSQIGLAERRNHYPAQLSGGEQQRVAVARALIGRPPLLLADEPTGNLDQTTGNQIIDLLFTMAGAQNTTVVMVTHDVALAKRCDRIIRLRDGVIEGA